VQPPQQPRSQAAFAGTVGGIVPFGRTASRHGYEGRFAALRQTNVEGCQIRVHTAGQAVDGAPLRFGIGRHGRRCTRIANCICVLHGSTEPVTGAAKAGVDARASGI